MKYRAAIFDLYGTLVGDNTGPPYTEVLYKIAALLSLPPQEFLAGWSETAEPRNLGVFPTIGDALVGICRDHGAAPDEDAIDRAARLRSDFGKNMLARPREQALETLAALQRMGMKLGLCSNCNPDTAANWETSPFESFFDAATFSCTAGLMKPDPEIYLRTAAALGAAPDDCVYIANGQHGELGGAFSEGMYPVLITPATDIPHILPEEDELALAKRSGRVIASLEEVLTIVR